MALDAIAALRLMQLVSPSLPTGAFAYSQGLETMVELGWIEGQSEAISYLESLMQVSLRTLELPTLERLVKGWQSEDLCAVERWSCWLLASRESAEMQAQDRQMANALARVLRQTCPEALRGRTPKTFAEAFACAAVAYWVPTGAILVGFAYSWCESHVAALAKILPLGPVATQRALNRLLLCVPSIVVSAGTISDDEIGATAPGLGLASALHETQHTRLFRS